MYNSLVRIQNTFGFFTSVLFFLGGLVALTDIFAERTPTASIKATNVQVVRGRPHYYSTKKEEYAIIKFNLDADLSSLFNWNTKQVFVYVTAEWGNRTAGRWANEAEHQAVIWDQIITSPSSDHLANIGPIAMKKLRRSAAGKSIDPSRGILKLKNQRPKYQITHPSGKVAETDNVRLRLNYSVQPWVGVMTWNQYLRFWNWYAIKGGASEAFALPAIKTKTDAKKA